MSTSTSSPSMRMMVPETVLFTSNELARSSYSTSILASSWCQSSSDSPRAFSRSASLTLYSRIRFRSTINEKSPFPSALSRGPQPHSRSPTHQALENMRETSAQTLAAPPEHLAGTENYTRTYAPDNGRQGQRPCTWCGFPFGSRRKRAPVIDQVTSPSTAQCGPRTQKCRPSLMMARKIFLERKRVLLSLEPQRGEILKPRSQRSEGL